MRFAFIIFQMFFRTIYYIFKINKLGLDTTKTDKECYDYIRKIVLLINKKGRVTIKATGMENIPKEEGFIFFSNHQGLYDVLGIIESCEHPISVIIKKELKNTIVVKQVVNCLRGMFIDRNDPRDGLRVIKNMSENVVNGKNYIIFPEGTRSKVPNKLCDFKAGTFKSAVYAKCPIVPIALIDAYKPFDENSIKKVNVYVNYLKPIYYDEYKDLKTKEIADIVKSRIEESMKNVINSNC